MEAKRNDIISITKGIGIILMVIGHSGALDFIHDFIYLFHMPLFFFITGYLLKLDYAEGWPEAKTFVVKRFKRLWYPYVKFGFIFILLHNLFCFLNLYNLSYGYNGNCIAKYSGNEIINHLGKTILMQGNEEQLLGAFWFLPQMLFGSLIAVFMLMTVSFVYDNIGCFLLQNEQVVKVVISLIIVMALTIIFYIRDLSLPYTKITWLSFYCAAFILSGLTFKLFDITVFTKPIIILTSLILLGISLFFSTSITMVTAYEILPYFITGIVGTWIIYSFAKILVEKFKSTSKIRQILTMSGDHSVVILTWHFLSFKFVSLLVIFLFGNYTIEHLASFPVINAQEVKTFFWILYTIAGIGIPLLFYVVWKSIIFKLIVNLKRQIVNVLPYNR